MRGAIEYEPIMPVDAAFMMLLTYPGWQAQIMIDALAFKSRFNPKAISILPSPARLMPIVC